METSVPQSSPSTSAPNKKERQKVLKQCERTILCIPDGTGKPLDDKEVRTALGVKYVPPLGDATRSSRIPCFHRRVVVIRDDHTGGYWVRGGDEAKQVFLNRLGERLPGYTARALVPEGDDWRRLLQKIEVGGGECLKVKRRKHGSCRSPLAPWERFSGSTAKFNRGGDRIVINFSPGYSTGRQSHSSWRKLGLAGRRKFWRGWVWI